MHDENMEELIEQTSASLRLHVYPRAWGWSVLGRSHVFAAGVGVDSPRAATSPLARAYRPLVGRGGAGPGVQKRVMMGQKSAKLGAKAGNHEQRSTSTPESYARAGQKWTDEEKAILRRPIRSGRDVEEIANQL